MGLSAFLIATDEEHRISKALDSLQWADELIVVDGGSRDRTQEICKGKGAKVYQRMFDNFEQQKNYALSLVNHEWALSIDADEVVTPSLAEEIKHIINQDQQHAGYLIKRRNRFLGKCLRFGRQGSEYILRLFCKRGAKFSGLVHETVQVDGSVGHLKNFIDHFGTENLDEYNEKLKLYIELEITKIISLGNFPSLFKSIFFPPTKWVLDYLLFGGFLDGQSGFLYHTLSCYYGWTKNFRAREYMKNINKIKLKR